MTREQAQKLQRGARVLIRRGLVQREGTVESVAETRSRSWWNGSTKSTSKYFRIVAEVAIMTAIGEKIVNRDTEHLDLVEVEK